MVVELCERSCYVCIKKCYSVGRDVHSPLRKLAVQKSACVPLFFQGFHLRNML